MCRFMIFKGSDPMLLSKLIVEPTHSILHQSYHPRLLITAGQRHTGDGFGIGYYTDRSLGPGPCIFTSVIPAWNCTNLPRLAAKTASPLVFAHMRATTEGALSDQNCHPFSHGSIMWMHNGGLSGWKYYKRRLGESLADRWYLQVGGGTDSEWAFALFLDTLEGMGHDPSSPPETGFGPTVLRKAMMKTIQRINGFISEIPERICLEEKIGASLLNFAVTDGLSIICTRYVSSKTDEAASLYYSSGTTWEDQSQKGEYQMDRRDKGADIVLVASEPLTFERGKLCFLYIYSLADKVENWVTVPTNSVLTIHKQTVMVHPIIDQFYDYSPDNRRSSQLVHTQGLSTNEDLVAPTPTLHDSNNNHKQLGHSRLHKDTPNTPYTQIPARTDDCPSNTPMRRLALNTQSSASDKFSLQELGNRRRKKKALPT